MKTLKKLLLIAIVVMASAMAYPSNFDGGAPPPCVPGTVCNPVQ